MSDSRRRGGVVRARGRGVHPGALAQALRSVVVAALLCTVALWSSSEPAAAAQVLSAGDVLRVSVPEAFGGKTVIGQLTVDHATTRGYVTAFGCDDGLPRDSAGRVTRSDLNFDGAVSPVASNRLMVQADADGDVCFYVHRPVAVIVDVNAVSFDTGISSFANRRTDTRNTASPLRAAGELLRVAVPEAAGRKTVVGQLTVDRASTRGYVTAFACDDGLPRDSAGRVSKSDLNFNGAVSPVASNRLMVQADADGDICFYLHRAAALVVDVNGVTDTGIEGIPNRRTDTRGTSKPTLPADGTLRISVPEAAGGKTVIGQLTVDRATTRGYVTAFACDDGLPRDASGDVTKSDLNFNGAVTPVASNRLLMQADADGEICFHVHRPVAVVVDVNGLASDIAISSFENRRTDTRTGTVPIEPIIPIGGVPTWPTYVPLPALDGVAALTGAPAFATVTRRPILAVKVDNYRSARPQWGLDKADAVIEVNVEGTTRFIALHHSRLPDELGPVRSARTGDLDLLAAMNRPIFGYSGANDGVMAWLKAAAASGVLADLSAQHSGCYSRVADRPGPHDLSLESSCALAARRSAGPARPLWSNTAEWTPSSSAPTSRDTSFSFRMDGVTVGWTWDPASRTYLRSQDGELHVAASEERIAATNVVEVFTKYEPSPVDARSPHAVTIGDGRAVVHRDGVAIEGTWFRPSPYDAFSFVAGRTGESIPLDVGTTFVEVRRS